LRHALQLLAKAMAEKAEHNADSDEETPPKQVVQSGVPAVDVPPAPAAVPPKQPVHRRLPQPPAKKTKLSPDPQVPTIRVSRGLGMQQQRQHQQQSSIASTTASSCSFCTGASA